MQLAVAYNYGRKGEDGKKPSQWVRASMFGKQAETLAPYLTKGKQVSLVIRDLHIATFQKQDGTTGTSLEGVADLSVRDNAVTFIYRGSVNGLTQRLAGLDLENLTVEEPDLEEIFLHYYQ